MAKAAVTPMPAGEQDDDAPELTPELLAKARPAREVLGAATQAVFKRPPGRPRAEDRKVPISLRLDPDVVDYYRNMGPGWQGRIRDILIREMKRGAG